MYKFLTGCKNWQLDSTSRNEYLIIYNYGLGQIISDNGMFNIGDEITLHPSRGTFDLQGGKYVVSKSGDNLRIGIKVFQCKRAIPTIKEYSPTLVEKYSFYG